MKKTLVRVLSLGMAFLLMFGGMTALAAEVKTETYKFETEDGYNLEVSNYIGETDEFDIPGIGFTSFSVYYISSENDSCPIKIHTDKIVDGKKVSFLEILIYDIFDGGVQVSGITANPDSPGTWNLAQLGTGVQFITGRLEFFFEGTGHERNRPEFDHFYIILTPQVADAYLSSEKMAYTYVDYNSPDNLIPVNIKIPGLKELIVSKIGDVSATPAPAKPSSWAEAEVNKAVAAGLVPQELQSKYTQVTTRAEFCALGVALYEKATGKAITGRKTFTDTKDVNIEKLAAVGVVNGTNTTGTQFSPDAQLTREQAATMLSRLADAVGKPLSKKAADFADTGSVSSWASEAVGQMQASGIMSGVGDNTFSPKGAYTREQSMIAILRLFDEVK